MTRYRYRRRYRGRMSGRSIAIAAAAGVVLAAAAHSAGTGNVRASLTAAKPPGAAAVAIAYARAQLGAPYTWGGTGPYASGFDCSGLVMEAYAAAGITIPRTSEAQWAGLPHVSPGQVEPGDLVFFPGSDGTWSAPGHVALVISSTEMIQAYTTGVPVLISPLNGNGAGGIVGYARPGGSS
jgi:cell wall-associated NlpC family hydrolase